MANLKDLKAYFEDGRWGRTVTTQEIKDLSVEERSELKALLP